MLVKLKEEHVSKICNELKDKKFGLTEIEFNYSFPQNKRILLIDTYGFSNMLPDFQSFYQNVEEHITYSYFRWLGPLTEHFSQELKVNLNAVVNVLENGEFDHSQINLQVSTPVFSNTINTHNELTLGKIFFEQVIPFYQYIDKVEFKSHQFKINQIVFHLKIDGEKIHRLINKTNINQRILSQWLATLDNFVKQSKKEFKLHTIINIIDGLMNTAKYKNSCSFHFTYKDTDRNLAWNSSNIK